MVGIQRIFCYRSKDEEMKTVQCAVCLFSIVPQHWTFNCGAIVFVCVHLCLCVCVRDKARVSVCWAAQSEPRVEVVFLLPMVSLGLCVHARTWGSLGPSEGAWGMVEGGMKRERDGGIGGQQGSRWERCRSGPIAKQKDGRSE